MGFLVVRVGGKKGKMGRGGLSLGPAGSKPIEICARVSESRGTSSAYHSLLFVLLNYGTSTEGAGGKVFF